ncbi:MAG: serine hydrolase domain-containing protein [Candidatus Tumulicola sp.]
MTALLLAAAFALPAAERTQIDAVVASVTREQHIAGLSLGIARSGRRLYLRGYGLRDVNRDLPADGFTVYRAGSIAKQFTAALVLRAVEAGRMHMPAVEHLLTQTSSDSGAWHYDNANYAQLGSMLEAASGRSFENLLRERITGPLGLESTGCRLPPYAGNAARGYAWNGSWTALQSGDDVPCSSAGLTANAPDLLAWLEALRSGSIVSAASFAAMTTSARLRSGIPANYGYGFFIADWFGYTVAEHSGNVPGYSALDAVVLRDGLEIAVLTNADAVDLTPLVKSVVAVLDPPLDRNLAATVGAPPQNENLGVTDALKALLQTSGFASYGTLDALEFVERSASAATTYDKYRATFSTGQWWVVLGYRAGDTIVSLSLSPVQ